jgi:hypothetical protein
MEYKIQTDGVRYRVVNSNGYLCYYTDYDFDGYPYKVEAIFTNKESAERFIKKQINDDLIKSGNWEDIEE